MKAHAREQVRDRDADARRRRGQRALGDADVRPATQQLHGLADTIDLRHLRQLDGQLELRLQRVRVHDP